MSAAQSASEKITSSEVTFAMTSSEVTFGKAHCAVLLQCDQRTQLILAAAARAAQRELARCDTFEDVVKICCTNKVDQQWFLKIVDNAKCKRIAQCLQQSKQLTTRSSDDSSESANEIYSI